MRVAHLEREEGHPGRGLPKTSEGLDVARISLIMAHGTGNDMNQIPSYKTLTEGH